MEAAENEGTHNHCKRHRQGIGEARPYLIVIDASDNVTIVWAIE
jgi:hypothetical protein